MLPCDCQDFLRGAELRRHPQDVYKRQAFISSVTYQKTEDLVPFLFEQGKNPLFVMLDGIDVYKRQSQEYAKATYSDYIKQRDAEWIAYLNEHAGESVMSCLVQSKDTLDKLPCACLLYTSRCV